MGILFHPSPLPGLAVQKLIISPGNHAFFGIIRFFAEFSDIDRICHRKSRHSSMFKSFAANVD